MKLKVGDVIEFELGADSCWGKKGKYKAMVLMDGKKNIIVHHLNLKLIEYRIESGCAEIGYDNLEEFLQCCHLENVKVLKNISFWR